MPTYDYQCQACGHEFEEFQSITASPLKKCPACGKLKLKRLIGTGAGVIFKGSGFYETDYRSEGYKKDEKAAKDAATKKPDDKKSDSKSQSDTSKKADSKPAATKKESGKKGKK